MRTVSKHRWHNICTQHENLIHSCREQRIVVRKKIIETNRSVMTKEQKFSVATKCVQRQKFFSSYGNYTKQMMFDPTKEICFLFVPSFWKHCNGLLRSDTNSIQSISWSLDFIYFSVSKALFKTLQNNCRSVDRCVLWFINMSSSFGICRIDNNMVPQATSHIEEICAEENRKFLFKGNCFRSILFFGSYDRRWWFCLTSAETKKGRRITKTIKAIVINQRVGPFHLNRHNNLGFEENKRKDKKQKRSPRCPINYYFKTNRDRSFERLSLGFSFLLLNNQRRKSTN